ncbi:hypothetical protein VTK56DRAFT_663 [Thermocarpiscus australiensis]
MNEPPSISPAHLAPRGRHVRSTSDSPTHQRNSDDLLSNLTPRTVVEAFRNPSGALKTCLDTSTSAEQAFALRVANTSNNILEWLEELSAWPWPARGGSAGFEMPSDKRRKLSSSDSELSDTGPSEDDQGPRSDQDYIGSLTRTDIARYERRIDEIAEGLEDLDIEEIKSQVLHNHIMPLSRPGTPILDSSRFAKSSFSTVARMDDLTALVTAMTVQALPNLSKLMRLMNIWNLRLLVLRKVPVFLESIADAEVALQSGWNAISLGVNANHDSDATNGCSSTGSTVLSRGDFEVMKAVLERKVAKAGRDLDAMLDLLEGQPDTLPESWIDRVDALEREYGEWIVACEKKIRETAWARVARETAVGTDSGQPMRQGTHGVTTTEQSLEMALPPNRSTSQGFGSDTQPQVDKPVIRIHHVPAETEAEADHLGSPVDLVSTSAEDQTPQRGGDCSESDGDGLSDGIFGGLKDAADLGSSGPGGAVHDNGNDNFTGAHRNQSDYNSEPSDTSDGDMAQRGLQSLPRTRRGSGISESSTVIHGPPVDFTGSFSSDQFDHGTPESRRRRDMDPEGSSIDDADTSDFPAAFRASTRSMSVSFNDKPTVTELPRFSSPPSTPTKSTILEDEDDDVVSTEPGSPSEMSVPRTDDQLQQQISEILELVPAKIRLTSEPPAINLNPPDFTMPTARKSSRSDAIPRSQSTLSMRSAYSRSGTPSFTLAPAYGRSSRPRHARSNREIKLYHLSRSNGEAPIKLFIRCVGENGERVMVRVGGGWADLGEYLKEYAMHHGRRSGADGKVEVKDIPRGTPPSRPASAQDAHAPISPLKLRKTRRPAGGGDDEAGNNLGSSSARPKTPLASTGKLEATPPSEASSRSRSSSRLSSKSWDEEDSSLGMAGPRAKQIEMSEESRAWVESVKEKVRIASGERKLGGTGAHALTHAHTPHPHPHPHPPGAALSESVVLRERLGEMGKVGSTKRLFRKG